MIGKLWHGDWMKNMTTRISLKAFHPVEYGSGVFGVEHNQKLLELNEFVACLLDVYEENNMSPLQILAEDKTAIRETLGPHFRSHLMALGARFEGGRIYFEGKKKMQLLDFLPVAVETVFQSVGPFASTQSQIRKAWGVSNANMKRDWVLSGYMLVFGVSSWYYWGPKKGFMVFSAFLSATSRHAPPRNEHVTKKPRVAFNIPLFQLPNTQVAVQTASSRQPVKKQNPTPPVLSSRSVKRKGGLVDRVRDTYEEVVGNPRGLKLYSMITNLYWQISGKKISISDRLSGKISLKQMYKYVLREIK